jgi:hypothetical protein
LRARFTALQPGPYRPTTVSPDSAAMSTLQHTDQRPRFRSSYVALLVAGLLLVIAAVTIVVVATGGSNSTDASAATLHPSQGLTQLVQAHVRREEQAPGGGY